MDESFRQMRIAVVVTGGSSGIGLSIVQRFLKLGYRTTSLDKDSDANVMASRQLIGSDGAFEALDIDIADSDAEDTLLSLLVNQDADRLVAINNASVRHKTNWMSESRISWLEQSDAALWGSFAIARATIRACLERGMSGSVLNIVSPVAHLVANQSPAYHASKAGLEALTRYFAVHGQRSGARVTVNSLSPGLIVQSRHLDRYRSQDSAEWRAICNSYLPGGKPGTEEDVAAAAEWITSPSAAFVNGACLTLDGGGTVQDQLLVLNAFAKR